MTGDLRKLCELSCVELIVSGSCFELDCIENYDFNIKKNIMMMPMRAVNAFVYVSLRFLSCVKLREVCFQLHCWGNDDCNIEKNLRWR